MSHAAERVALIQAPRADAKWPDTAIDEVVELLRADGIDACKQAWYDPGVDWREFGLVVLRSPWDIYWHLTEFHDWLDLIGPLTKLCNPAPVLRWNLDKRYLLELAAAGIPTAPTAIVEIGGELTVPAGEFVVKPVTSGGAMMTARYDPTQARAARTHIVSLHEAGLAAIVQPYLPSVDETGEKALVFYEGVLDHAILKQAVLSRGEAPDAHRDSHPNPVPCEPTAAELEVAYRALAAVPADGPLLFARIDIAAGLDSEPAIMEVELTDPDLFFDFSAGSLQRYAAAIAARARQLPS